MGFNWRRDRSRQAGDWRLLLSDRFRIVGLSHSVAILLPFCRLTAGGLPQGNGSWRPANTRFLVSHLDLVKFLVESLACSSNLRSVSCRRQGQSRIGSSHGFDLLDDDHLSSTATRAGRAHSLRIALSAGLPNFTD